MVESLDLLFDANSIPTAAHALFGDEFNLRPLAIDDYDRGHLKVLQVLTKTPDVGKQAYTEQFRLMQRGKPTAYYILAICDAKSSDLLAVGSLILEWKFIRNNGICGHIEDIAVDAKAQGKGLGKKLIKALSLLSEHLGAYKTILDCSKDNEGFYEKCGYQNKGVQMAKYRQ